MLLDNLIVLYVTSELDLRQEVNQSSSDCIHFLSLSLLAQSHKIREPVKGDRSETLDRRATCGSLKA